MRPFVEPRLYVGLPFARYLILLIFAPVPAADAVFSLGGRCLGSRLRWFEGCAGFIPTVEDASRWARDRTTKFEIFFWWQWVVHHFKARIHFSIIVQEIHQPSVGLPQMAIDEAVLAVTVCLGRSPLFELFCGLVRLLIRPLYLVTCRRLLHF